jgi:organic radical activating enzyme
MKQESITPKSYGAVEIFFSIQSEIAIVGDADKYIRFAGCNLAFNSETIDSVLQPVSDTLFTDGL